MKRSFRLLVVSILLPTWCWAQANVDSSLPTLATQVKPQEDNIKPQAQEAKKKANWGSVAAGVAAGVLGMKAMAACAPVKPDWTCPAYVAGTIAAGVIAVNMSRASNKADSTIAASTGVNPQISEDADPRMEIKKNPQLKKLEESLAALEKKGFKFDLKKKTATLPNGKTVSADSVASADAMSSAGYSQAQIKDFQKDMQAVNQEAAKIAGAADKSAAVEGGGGISVGASVPELPDPVLPTANEKIEVSRDPAAVAGMVKNFGGEPIGISQDNAFTMINRQYVKQASFQTLDVGPAQPAAIQNSK